MPFALKSVLGTLLAPVTAGVLFLLVAFALSLTERFRRVGQIALGVGLVCAYLLGTTPVADALIRPLESRYAAVHDPRFFGEEIRWVVVLGAGHTSDPGYPAPARITDEGLYRLVEGVRLHRQLPGSRLVVSGAGGSGPVPHAEAARDAAVAMGVDPARIHLEPTTRDTAEEAARVAALLAGDVTPAGDSIGQPFLLVTSAAHMPRTVLHFRARGLNPIPAPAQAYALEGGRLELSDLVPRAKNYRKVERVVHEYLGLAWARLSGAGE